MRMRLIMVLCLISFSSAVFARPELIAWYKLDGNFKDSSGNKYHLKSLSKTNIFSDAPEIVGVKNKCFGPTAVPKGKFGAIGPSLPLDSQKGFTICGFIRLPQGNSYGGRFFGCGTEANNLPGALFFSSWGIVNSKAGNDGGYSYQRFADKQWHHYALVIPPVSGKTGKYTVYVDGKKVYTAKLQALKDYGKFGIGLINITQAYGIRIDEVKVFDGPLTSSELASEAKPGGLQLSQSQLAF